MKFELTKEQKQIRKAARDFVKGEFKKEAIDALLESREFPEKILLKGADLGFSGIHIPEKFDGEGLGHQEKAIIAEELARGHSTLGGCLALAGYGADIILSHGTDVQKEKWLPAVAAGEVLIGTALEEDVSLPSAVKEEDGSRVISGTASIVVNGGCLAKAYIVLCKTGSQDRENSVFLLDARLPGITVSDAGKRLGQSMVPLARVEFENVRVTQEDLIGKEHRGKEQVREAMAAGSLTLAALAAGTAQGVFDRAYAHVKQREQFGKKIIQFQITRHKLALMATKIDMARLMVQRAGAALDSGKEQVRASSMAKLAACRAAVEVCDEALQLFGGYGYIREYEIEAFYRDAKMLELFSGGPHALKNIISDNLTGTF